MQSRRTMMGIGLAMVLLAILFFCENPNMGRP